MIQFNLLPDVKIAFIKAERQKRIVMAVSTIASIAAVAILIVAFSFVHGVQKKSISDLTIDIKKYNTKLMSSDDLDLNKVLTIQNQLNSLDSLHNSKVVASRLFPYIQQTTPSDVTISQMVVDFTANTISITGNAPALSSVNRYADALKFTKYTIKDSDEKTSAFQNVVLTSFSIDQGKPKYTFDMSFDPVLFAQGDVTLEVPNTITTRSVTELPNTFKGGGQ